MILRYNVTSSYVLLIQAATLHVSVHLDLSCRCVDLCRKKGTVHKKGTEHKKDHLCYVSYCYVPVI